MHVAAARQLVTHKENTLLKTEKSKSEEEEVKVPDTERDDLAKRKSQSVLPQPQEDTFFVNASITKADLETWKRLKLSGEPRYSVILCVLWTGWAP